ncbi:MAG: DUF3343 domain-containing protein, partial [Chitinivibrionales bacterium]|nr:DUF3343 domain-containing protein [Chitinivibrionales bacterium]
NLLLLCQSTHDVILVERFCREAGLTCTAIPVPREFSSECGIALTLASEDRERIEAFMGEKNIAGDWHVL